MKPGRTWLLLVAAVLALGAVAASFLFVQARERQRAAEAQLEARRDAVEARLRAGEPASVEAPPAELRGAAATAEPERTEAGVRALELSVVDPEGSPVADAKVVVFRAGAVLADGTTGADGLARFRDLEGSAEYVIAAPGWEFARGELELAAGPRTIALQDGAELAGVARVDGRPPAEPFEMQWGSDADGGASALPPAVAKLLRDPVSKLSLAGIRTHADGSFRLRGVRADSPGSLRWSARYFLADAEHEYEARQLFLQAPRADLVLELVEGCELRLRVVDPEGAPVPRANLTLFRAVENDSGSRTGTSGAAADEEGRYREVLLPDPVETFAVSVAAAGSSAMKRHELARPAVLRGIWDVGDLATIATRAITVTVQDPEGRPLAGADAYPWPSQRNRELPRAGDDGRVTVHIGIECTQVAAEAFGFASALVAVAPEASEVTATLERACLVEFQLEGESAQREGLAVELRGPTPMFVDEDHFSPGGELPARPRTPRTESGAGLSSSSSPDGTKLTLRTWRKKTGLRLAGLRPGEPFQAQLIGGGEVLCAVDVAPLRPGEQRVVPMRIDRVGRSLLIRVLSPSREPVSRATIYTLEGERRNSFRGSHANAQGEFELKALYGDRCVFVVNSELYAPKRILLQPIPEGPYEVVLEAGQELEVELVDPGGSPFTGMVDFRADIGGPGSLRKTSLGPGRYRVLGLPSGDVLLELFGHFNTLARLHRGGDPHPRIVIGEPGSLQVRIQGGPDSADGVWMLALAPAGSERELTRAAILLPDQGEPFCGFFGLAAGSYEVGFVRCTDPAIGDWQHVGATQTVEVTAEHANVDVVLALPR